MLPGHFDVGSAPEEGRVDPWSGRPRRAATPETLYVDAAGFVNLALTMWRRSRRTQKEPGPRIDLLPDRDPWRAVCFRRGGGRDVIERIVARLGLKERRGLGFRGGDRALATTLGRHHGQAICIDSFEVDVCLILGPPPGSVKAPRRILASPGCVRMRNVVRGLRG
jgi:hypothetical protein